MEPPTDEKIVEHVEARTKEIVITNINVKSNILKAQKKQREAYEKTHTKRTYTELSIGDSVLLHNSRNLARKGKADLRQKYDGPYTLYSITGKLAQLKNTNGLILKKSYSIDRLKLFNTEQQHIPEISNNKSTVEPEEPKKTEATNISKLVEKGTIQKLLHKLAKIRPTIPQAKSVCEHNALLKTSPIFSLVSEVII